ncbi:hybrid sensor histidine kinase/response regulator [Rhodovulum sulfidophilum]|uniref:sensor histidine kinase n=1 Tax=Rhodovulum sulfidophilum TaxID=35806 RepID=UPI001389C385|nr:hybrid sensor histidine kinase/response regulator [Rhodovulum sulfidophilum]MBL3584000.1 hybrid sensor histidine kinase/response regulator [Rhodovulum sulfidophilum]NDK33657.1 hybrid sensor histidine kinase/response regulator [Rhodovulum sulfidophilum]
MRDLDVMIIDDDAGDRKLIRRFLERSGMCRTICEAELVHSALDHVAETFDAVFLDYVMPGENGLDGLETLRQKWPTAAFILMTGQGDEQIAKSSILAGAADYTPKSRINQTGLERMLVRAVEVVRLAQRVEEQRQELLTFSNVLVHDFRAPIRSIRFICEQLDEELGGAQSSELRKLMELMKKTATQMSQLVEALASHIRTDADPVFECISVSDLVENALSFLDHDIRESGACIDLDLPDIDVFCSPAMMAQLIQNLVQNAIKYSGGGLPNVRIVARRLDNGDVLFEIADRGVGVPEEYRQRIFEPFQRLAQASNMPGTGLGLATCQKIVKRHGGRIWCDANPYGGTLMRFRMPTGRKPFDSVTSKVWKTRSDGAAAIR